MLELLKAALDDTLSEMEKDFSVAPIEAWNESVFRFIFCKNINKQNKEISQLIECNRIDLVLHKGGLSSFIEFKFYIHSSRFDPCTQNIMGRKSYPSDKNFSEFENSAKKLINQKETKSTSKFIILFYADPNPCDFARTYDSYYKKEIIKLPQEFQECQKCQERQERQERQEFELPIIQKYRKNIELRNSKNKATNCNAVIYELGKVLAPKKPEGTKVCHAT